MLFNELYSVKKNYLYEGLDSSAIRSVMLWENAGSVLVEYQMTADQISQLFQQVEQGATAAGGNRTLIGQGKDAASAVNTAWEDLKTKVQNSGPIKNVDAMYDQAAAKLKQATGGDQGVMQYVQKYRDFAKKHPIAQSLIYSALIAAAGISGAGAGGAAALGLLKMTDKLLQGEKFSSAAYSGAKTGAMAYGASKVADLFRSEQPAPGAATSGLTQGLNTEQVSYLQDLSKQGGTAIVKDNALWVQLPDGELQMLTAPHGVDPNTMLKIFDGGANSNVVSNVAAAPARAVELGTPPVPTGADIDAAQKLTASQMSAIDKALATGQKLSPQLQASYDLTKGDAGNRLGAMNSNWYKESAIPTGVMLTNEGIADTFKSAAGKVGQWAKTKGHNLTTKVTADKLTTAWKKAGSPLDSEAVKLIMKQSGVADDVIASSMPASTKRAAKAPKTTPGASAFGQMANQLTAKPTPSSTGGSISKVGNRTIHTASPTNPNQPAAAVPAKSTAPEIGTQTGAINPATGRAYVPSDFPDEPEASAAPAGGVPVTPTAPTPKGSGGIRAGLKQAKQAVDTAVGTIKKVRSRDRQNAIAYAQKEVAAIPNVKTKTLPAPATPTTPQWAGRAKPAAAKTTKISAPPSSGAPTAAERAKLDQKIQAALAKQKPVAESLVWSKNFDPSRSLLKQIKRS